PLLSWGTTDAPSVAVLHLPVSVEEDTVIAFLDERLVRDIKDHPVTFALELMKTDPLSRARILRDKAREAPPCGRATLDWVAALTSELAPDATSQLQTVRRDYLEGNLRSVMSRTTEQHLRRSLFQPWDYADGLDNQSLHWEPSEDRRHAYQWY